MLREMPILKKVLSFFLYIFATVGFVLTFGFFAIRWGLTNTSGVIDIKNTNFSINAQKMKMLGKADVDPQITGDLTIASLDNEIRRLQKIKDIRTKNYCKIQATEEHYPLNANNIFKIAQKTKSDQVLTKAITALEIGISDNDPLKNKLANCNDNSLVLGVDFSSLEQKTPVMEGENAFYWINTPEWQSIKEATIKDKQFIDQVSQITGIESRLIVSSMIVEQLRLFNSQRNLFKKVFEPLKILSSANKISLGVMGIKEQTAIDIELNLKDPASDFYLGKDLESILDFKTIYISQERYDRLASEKDHYYSYLYGALFLKQVMQQWEKAGYSIKYRPEIVGTLFNVGFSQSKPNPDPKVGGSKIKIGEREYSFGSLAYEFYYSGELLEEFPYEIN